MCQSGENVKAVPRFRHRSQEVECFLDVLWDSQHPYRRMSDMPTTRHYLECSDGKEAQI